MKNKKHQFKDMAKASDGDELNISASKPAKAVLTPVMELIKLPLPLDQMQESTQDELILYI